MSDTPNPGSTAAIALGCCCPMLDNSYGTGYFGGSATDDDGATLFVIVEGCPLHAPSPDHKPE